MAYLAYIQLSRVARLGGMILLHTWIDLPLTESLNSHDALFAACDMRGIC